MKRRVNENGKQFDGKRRSGAAAVELAILLPFLALLFGATVDFCRVFYVTQTIQNCAYVGALYASETADAPANYTQPEDIAKAAAVGEGISLNPPLQAANVATTFDGGRVTVSVKYDFALLTPFLGLKTRTITRSVTMAVAP